MTHARVRPGPAHSGIRSESRYHVPPRPPNPCRGGVVFPRADSTNETTAPRYRPGSGTSPAPGTADPGDHSTPAAAPLRIYPARSAGPGFRVSPSVRIPGNCACVRPPNRMPPPTRTANRIIGRTRLSGCGPPANRPYIRRPARSESGSPGCHPFRSPPHTYVAPPGPYPLRPLSLPPTHTAPGPDPAPVRPILPIPFAPFSLYSASFSRLLLRAFPFLQIFSIRNLFYRKIISTFVPLSLTNNDENA